MGTNLFTLYSTQTPLDAFEMLNFENIMENGTIPPEELMFHFPYFFSKLLKCKKILFGK